MSIDDEVRRVSDAVAARVREDVARELQAVLDSRPAPPAPAARQPVRDDSQLAVQQFARGMTALHQATSLTAALDALAVAASEVAARVAVLLVDDSGRLRPWRVSGFGPQADGQAWDPSSKEAGWALTTGAVNAAAQALAEGRDIDGLPEYVSDGCLGKRLLVPINIEGKVICALYADQGWTGLGDTPAWGHALEVLAFHASTCLEVVTLRKTVELMGSRPVRVVPTVAVQSGERGHGDPESARRYARLLISEIKLYHEPQVLAGRKERDLATRLSGEIARARSLYHQRVPTALTRADEYFQAELVRTLANGDEALLGV